MKKSKFILFINFILFFISCSRFFYETTNIIRPEDPKFSSDYWDTLNINKKAPNLILIGFHTYKIGNKESSFIETETFAELDLNTDTYKYFKRGTYIDNIKSNSYVSINQKNASRFILDYLNQTGTEGKNEILKLLVPSPTNKNNYKMKKTNADYFVVAIHKPYYHERSKAAINSVTGFFGILTFGLIPIYEVSNAETLFNIYDKNLNYFSSFLYKREYTIISALWMWPNQGFQTFFTQDETPPQEAYKIHVEEFERELLFQLNQLK